MQSYAYPPSGFHAPPPQGGASGGPPPSGGPSNQGPSGGWSTMPWNPTPAAAVFCCGHVQRVANATNTVHAYSNRLAWFTEYVSHPTIATYVQPPNVAYDPAYFGYPPESFVEPQPATTGNNRSQGSGYNSPRSALGSPRGFSFQPGVQLQQNAPFQPAAFQPGGFQPGQFREMSFGTASQWGYPPPHNSGFQGYQAGGNQQQMGRPLANNQSAPTVAELQYNIPPHVALPLPRFTPPNEQINVKFRLERYRVPLVAPQPNSPRVRDEMEIVWYYWPVKLQVPVWARGFDPNNPNQQVLAQMYAEQMRVINGERWGFVQDSEEREGLWHKRRSYKLFECAACSRAWKVTVFVRRGY